MLFRIVTETEKLNLLVANKMMKTLFCSMLEAKPEVASSRHRIASVERLRILSVSAVVCFHGASGYPLVRDVGTIGILVFLLSLCVFVANRTDERNMSDVLKLKARRLLKPWLFWSVIYGGLVLAKVILRDVPISEAFHPKMLLIGTRTHLWFLPFAFVVAMFLALVRQKIGGIPKLFTILAAILIGALCVCGCSILQSRFQPPTPLRQWILGVPAIVLGLAIGRITLLRKAQDRRNLYVFTVLSTAASYILLALLCHSLWSDYAGMFAMRYCISVAVLCSALHWQGSPDPISKKLAPLSYGVYLIHPLVQVFLRELNIAVQRPVVSLLLVLLISALITNVIRKTPFRQFV